jgi:hypothetical protein
LSGGIAAGVQIVAHEVVPGHLRNLRERQQVRIRPVLRHPKHEHVGCRLSIRRVVRDRKLHANSRGDRAKRRVTASIHLRILYIASQQLDAFFIRHWLYWLHGM